MKKLAFILPLFCLLALPFLTGCHIPPRKAAYNTLATIGYSVEKAMKTYSHACALGKVSAEMQKKVDDLHDNQFAPAYTAAVVAAKGDYTQLSPEKVSQLASQLCQLIAQIKL